MILKKTSSPSNISAVASLGLAALLLIAVSINSPGFLSVPNMRSLLVGLGLIGLVALGQTLVILGGGIDLSVPWLVAFGGLVTAQLTSITDLPILAVVLIVVLLAALIGLISGFGVVRLNIPPIVMTLGVGGLVQGLLLELQAQGSASGGSSPVQIQEFMSWSLGPVPALAIVLAVLAVLTALLLTRTPFGRKLYATGLNARVAALAGVRSGRLRASTYAISAAAAALTGILLAGYIKQAFLGMGQPFLFTSIAAVAIGGASLLGGVGNYWGTLAGALVLTLLEATLPVFQLSLAQLQIVYGLIIVLGVLATKIPPKWFSRIKNAPDKETNPTRDQKQHSEA